MDLEGAKMTVDELLKAQTHICNHIFNFINSMALKCAVQLEIPDAIHRHGARPVPLSQLVSSLQLNPERTEDLRRLMRILVHSGFFGMSKNGDGEEEGYVLTNSSRLLLKDNPWTMTPFLLSMIEPALVEPSQFLSAWLRTEDRTPFDTAHGMSFWEYMGRHKPSGDIFNAAMGSDARLVMSIVLDKCKSVFEGVGSIVDVGGGTGTVAKAIAEAFPNVECTVFDLPQVVAGLKGEDNLKYVEGDMFETIPSADALLFKSVLHNWSDEECVKILKKCKEAIPSNEKKEKNHGN